MYTVPVTERHRPAPCLRTSRPADTLAPSPSPGPILAFCSVGPWKGRCTPRLGEPGPPRSLPAGVVGFRLQSGRFDREYRRPGPEKDCGSDGQRGQQWIEVRDPDDRRPVRSRQPPRHRPEHRHRHTANARLQLAASDRHPGQLGDRDGTSKALGRGNGVRGVGPKTLRGRPIRSPARGRRRAPPGRSRWGGPAGSEPRGDGRRLLARFFSR